MVLRHGKPLACYINMRGGARGARDGTRHHVKPYLPPPLGITLKP
jgi:hypothetical protein